MRIFFILLGLTLPWDALDVPEFLNTWMLTIFQNRFYCKILEIRSLWFNLRVPWVLIVFEKKSCKVFAISFSFIRIFWFSTKIIFFPADICLEALVLQLSKLCLWYFFRWGYYNSYFSFFLVVIHKYLMLCVTFHIFITSTFISQFWTLQDFFTYWSN